MNKTIEDLKLLELIGDQVRENGHLSMKQLKELKRRFPNILAFFSGLLGVIPKTFINRLKQGEIDAARAIWLLQKAALDILKQEYMIELEEGEQ